MAGKVCECGQAVSGPHAKFCQQCVAKRRVKRRKYEPSPQVDQMIVDAYRKYRVYGSRTAIPNLAKRLEWPKFAVVRRARDLGLARIKESPWTDLEDQLLERYQWMCPEGIAAKFREAGLRRSATAIHIRRSRLHLRKNGDFFSATKLAAALGCDSHKVTRWIRSGLLKAEMKGSARTSDQGGDAFVISRAAVADFLRRCPEEYDLARVEKFWFLDLLTDGRICR